MAKAVSIKCTVKCRLGVDDFDTYEFLVDFVSPEYNELAGKVKDLAAGAVLFAALMAAAIGVLIFGPYLLALIF